MFDTFQPFLGIQKQNFAFKPTRFEIWMQGKLVKSGNTSTVISANVVYEEQAEKVEIRFYETALNQELAQTNIFDQFITATDRLQLITIPQETNIQNVAIEMFRMNIGPTRQRKDFNRNEPFCCNLFLQEGAIAKVTFSFSNPEKLIEFYQDIDESFKFHKDYRHSGHTPIINFFRRNKFGSNNPVMTYLSILAVIDRCIILEELYNPNVLDSVINDKLLLAYVTSGKVELAQNVIRNAVQNGEDETNVWALESKLDLGLAPTRNRVQRVAIYDDFLAEANDSLEIEFLNLLISFCNKYYE